MSTQRLPLALSAALLILLSAACGGGDAPDLAADITAPPTDSAARGAPLARSSAPPMSPPNRRPAEAEGRSEGGPDTAQQSDAYAAAMVAGEAALYSGRYEDARVAYLEAVSLRPDSMSPALGALRSMDIGGHAEAHTGIGKRVARKIAAYRAHPETQGAAYLLGARLALAQTEVGKALDEARLAVQHMPDLGVAWRVLGEAAAAAELWGEAVEALQTAVALGLRAEAGTWERLADALDELGELEAAEQAAQTALDLTGSDPNAQRRRHNMMAVIQKHAGQLEQAAETLEIARSLGPNDPAVLHNLGTLAEAMGDSEAALAHYTAATKTVPIPTTLWRHGTLLLKLDRPAEALKAFTRASANLARWSWPASTRWLAPFDVGKIYARADRYEDAIGWFEDALREARTPRATQEVLSWLAYTRTLAVGDAP